MSETHAKMHQIISVQRSYSTSETSSRTTFKGGDVLTFQVAHIRRGGLAVSLIGHRIQSRLCTRPRWAASLRTPGEGASRTIRGDSQVLSSLGALPQTEDGSKRELLKRSTIREGGLLDESPQGGKTRAEGDALGTR